MSNKELIYKAREWVRSGHARGESGYLIGTLADALKAAQQRITELEAGSVFRDTIDEQRAYIAKLTAELDKARAEIERRPEPAFRDALIADRNKAEAERDALAFALDAIRKWRHDWFNEPVEGVKRQAHVRHLDAILDTTPADHLNTVKAEPSANALIDLWWETCDDAWAIPSELIVKFGRAARAWPNPYRTGTQQEEQAVECLDCGRTDGGCDRTEQGEQA